MDYTEQLMNKEDIFSGRIIYVHRDDVLLPDGSTSIREIVEHSGGVAVLPLEEDGTVWCVRQYRYAMERHILELPAGKLNDGEEPFVCAKRELSEETGLEADNYVYLGSFLPSAGYCKETVHMYLATGLRRGEAHPDEGEFLDVEKHSFDELYAQVLRGEIDDAKTLIAILKTKAYLNGEM